MKRLWRAIVRWVTDPAALPEEIGTKAGIGKHRPIPIELGFYLHADGKVYFRNRLNHSLIKCENEEIIGLVYHEYNVMVEQGRKDAEAKTKRRKKEALKAARKADVQVDTPD